MFTKLNSFTLRTRVVLVTSLILLAVLVINYVVFIDGHRESAEAALVARAAAFTAVADEAKNYVAKLNNSQVFQSEALMAELKESIAAGKKVAETRIYNTIPVVAGWSAAQEAAAREDIEFRITSFEARNKSNEPDPGSFEADLLQELTDQVAEGSAEVAYRVNEQTNELHYMRAIRLAADCLMCHGHPGNEWDTDNDGLDPVGFQMESWSVGYMHGSYHVVLPLTPVDAQVSSFISGGLVWTVPAVIAALFLFIVMIQRMFDRPITALIERIKDIAQGEGDLTQRVPVKSDDEIGQLGKWFNLFVEKIHDVVVEVSGASMEVASASTQIAASSDEMSRGMADQNSQVTQVSAAVEQMSQSVVEVAKRSTEAVEKANRSGDAAKEGGTVVHQTIEGMEAIREAVSAGAASVIELGKRGEQIGQIIEVINDIADQTNLLCLNAAIEAARAGEHGRGFAVVADEVRKLADRTTKATDEIAQSITAIQSETGDAVGRMEAGTEQVEIGVARAAEAGKNLEQIVTSAQEVAGVIQSIAAAAEQQAAASEQISKSMDAISSISDQTEQGAVQSASAVTGLAERSSQLQTLISRFKVDSDIGVDNSKWARQRGGPVCLLLVDDDPAALRLLQEYLNAYGDCTVASSGKEALAVFRQHLDQGRVIDAVCLDIDMPGLDGRETLREMRSLESTYGVGRRDRSKISMVTALDTPEDRLKAMGSDCDTYVTKPIDRSVLEKNMKSLGFTKKKASKRA